jgi:hypothetical protein
MPLLPRTRYEYARCEVSLIEHLTTTTMGYDKNDFLGNTWLLLGDANVQHLEANEDIWVNLSFQRGGSGHRLQYVGSVCAFGHIFLCYRHDRHDTGVMVRKLSDRPRVFTLSTRLTSKDDLTLGSPVMAAVRLVQVGDQVTVRACGAEVC